MPIGDPGWRALAYSVFYTVVCLLPVWVLYRKKNLHKGLAFSLTQYFDLNAYVRPIVNWNEFGFVGGVVAVPMKGASFR